MAKIVNLLKTALIPIACLWVVEAVNLPLGHSLGRLGIFPRSLEGLVGIPLSPFIHASSFHAASNTVPLLILGMLVLSDGVRRYVQLTATIILGGGLLVWFLGREAYHVGASSLIFGYFGYLLAKGFFQRDLKSILIALVTIFLYGGLVFGLLPLSAYISFEAHLFGFLAGGTFAYFSARYLAPA